MSIKETVESFIKFRRSIGRKDQSTTYSLRLFAKFIGETTELTSITESDCNARNRHTTPFDSRVVFHTLLGIGGIETEYRDDRLSLISPSFHLEKRYYVGEQNIPIPVFLPKAPEYYPAYIYTDDELKRLFDCALTYRKYRSFVNEPICIRYILMITYMLGLRISETLSLKIKDIDMDNMYVHIHCSKFYKSRLVTFNEQVSKLMQEILQWRSTQMSPMVEDAYVFINQKGKPVNFVSLHQIFATIRKNAGLYFPDRGRHQPRIHDLRHTFAVDVLTNWYKSGKNVQDLLPKLSIYLGHLNVSFTSVYLTKTPTLLQEANKLFYAYKNTNNEEQKNY